MSEPGVDGEIESLRRTAGKVDGDNRAYSEDSQAVLRNQRSMIDKLKGDNDQLKEELQLEKRHAKVYDSVSAQAQIAKLQDTGDMYTRKIELEKRRIEELDKQMEIMHKKIWEQRQKMGGVNASRENNQAIAKQIQILENRLDKALKRYNEALANNKRLRENIDNLRRERLVFDQIYRKLEKELAEKKKEMARIIEISNKAYEARDAAQSEMSALKSQADKEQEDFEREWKELGKMIEQDRKMKDFMKKEREKLSAQEHRGDMTVEQEQSLKKKVLRGNWGIAKDRASIHASMEKVQSYEEAFAKIQAATGISDIDELVTTFINAEDQNFALFNYVNELNGECEKLEEQIADIRSEIEKYKGQGLNTDNQRKKILKDLEERLQKTEAKAEQYEKKYEAAMKTVNTLKVGIQSIFKKIGCDTPANLEMLGNEGVTESNMMQYLGIIEQRTNEILQLYAATQAREGVTDTSGQPVPAVASILGQGPQLPAGRNNITIMPPSATDEAYDSEEDSDDEDEDRPYSRDELKAKTMRGLHKRENKEKKKDRSKGKKGEPSRRDMAAAPVGRVFQFKLVLLGDSAVGKSSLVLRFVRGQFFEYQESTIGAAFLTQTVALNDTTVKFEIWDTAGQERYHSLAPMYYRGAAAAIVVYDITNRDTFQRAKQWVKELQRQGNPNIVIALAGNKSDLNSKRKVEPEEAESYASDNGIFFMETSAKTATNVNELFVAIARKLPKNTPQPRAGGQGLVIATDTRGSESKKGCC